MNTKVNIRKIDEYTYYIDNVKYDYREDGVREWIDTLLKENEAQELEINKKDKVQEPIVVQVPKQSKKGEVAMPTYQIALTKGEYVVLSTLLDKKYSTFSTTNKNCRILLREDYVKYKKEMINSTYDEKEGKKRMSTRTWERNFRNMVDCGIIEEVRNSNGKIYKYHIYNKNEVGSEFVMIESEILSQLKKVYKSQALKLYCIIRYCCYNKFTKKYDLRRKIDLKYMCEKLGISEENDRHITKVLDELQGASYIRRYKKTKLAENSEYQITYYEYEIVPYEEWKKARRPIEE